MFYKNKKQWIVDRLADFRCISFPALNTLPIELTQTPLSFMSWITLKDTKDVWYCWVRQRTELKLARISYKPDLIKSFPVQMPRIWQ